ncbi:N utilization substance protein B [bacterium HR32]|nr:N utilization substance protein B [bacterium HR32]
MSSRHKARQAVLQVLYQAEVGRQRVEDVLSRYAEGWSAPDDGSPEPWDEEDWRFVVRLSRGAWEGRRELDALVGQFAEGWDVDRIARVDLSILRMALYELLHLDTPPAVVINEAVELAKRYSTEDSGRFVNGILGRVYRELVEPRARSTQPS